MPDPESPSGQIENGPREAVSNSSSKPKPSVGTAAASTEVHNDKQGDGKESGAFEEPKAKRGRKKAGKNVLDNPEEVAKESKQTNTPNVSYQDL